ncbi:MAG TPA: FliH/SctL family protein [Noviherbaspirillum sp.]|jgi:flagellar assembly protein FliH|uniref:FliH/SctL family protein n=1 Tax=Noviherbaspirillum sp. TaxID=1926288 RepID=UPI002F959ACD
MSSPVIPKEHLSAYQRWEMASFGEDRPTITQSPAALEQAARKAAEDAARLREEAQREGYAEGHAQGHAAGMQAGMDEGRAIAAREAAQLRMVADAFAGETMRAGETVAHDMLALALDLAKAMLKTALKAKPELVLPVVTEAIRYLPVVQQPAQLVLHPDDAAVVRGHIGDELAVGGWRIVEDHGMERGGCRVDTASNQIDASPQVRWQRIAEALGKQGEWLE